ncbi:hypothetical protein EVAR_84384_1 [Eumeta japonica]|uniref:Reverse transcriptase domain-containing protein n=1 Tax=Eumeta variegata TaxID=151549 RepID=A0A4C1U564_EUMVA|nr:hypothetical protein EVAR_84384_1 [Eumeta japonica]
MMRAGEGTMTTLLYQFFDKRWKSRRVPKDWCKAVVVPLYKGKGSRQRCIVSPWLNLFMDNCLYDSKEYECGLRMDELSIKCLPYADDQIIAMVTKINNVNDNGNDNDNKKNESRINAVGMRFLGSVCGVSRKGRCRNGDARESRGLKEDVTIRLERGMLRWFGRRKMMNESRLTKQIYRASVCNEKVDKGCPKNFYADHIRGVLKKSQILGTGNRRVCMKRLMDVNKVREIYKDRSMWKSIVSAYYFGKKASACMDIVRFLSAFISTDHSVNHYSDVVHSFDFGSGFALDSDSVLDLE